MRERASQWDEAVFWQISGDVDNCKKVEVEEVREDLVALACMV